MKIRRLIKSFRYGEKGFTLIELLVVIAILGILAAIVVPNFSKFFGKGEEEACNIELRMVQTATMAYLADNGTCPASGAALETAGYFGASSTLKGTYAITAVGSPVVTDCTIVPTCP
jgi:type IV pilus assembly protein PilA